jgi:hypothetical protein
LLAHRINLPVEIVLSGDSSETETPTSVLEQEGVARVQGPAGDEALRDLVLKSLTVPIEDGVLELFPRVVGLRRSESGMTVELEIPEMMG